MPNHRLHGEWVSTRIGEVSGNPTAIEPDGNIYLRMTNAATGEIQPGSNHDGVPVTGPPTPTGVSIELEQRTADFTLRYKGFLLPEINTGGQRVMVLSGRWVRTPTMRAQEEGTWVATKTG
jgi:hypothetical protein